MLHYVKLLGSFHSVWPGLIGQCAVPGNYEEIWGDVATHSTQQPEFDRNQIVSRQTDRAVGLGASGEHYLSHSQSIDPAAVVRLEVISNVGYGARPKTADSARQTDVTWAEARPMALLSVLGFPCAVPTPQRQGKCCPNPPTTWSTSNCPRLSSG